MKAWLHTAPPSLPPRFVRVKSLPLTDRGFRYGMSVFESLRVSGGKPEFFDKHLSRLITACAERDFAVDERVLASTERLLKHDGFARIYVTAGDGALTSPASAPRVYVFIEPRDPPTDESWEVTISDDTVRPLFGGTKTANYWFNADALAQARARRFDEVILFNDLAELVSVACANIFLVRDDRILTPSRSSGCRQGVIREWVIARRKVEERRLRREDVLNAEEIFITNSWLGVMPISTVEGRPLSRPFIAPKLAAELTNRRAS
jgi:branched-subunit amino acid aminotransferase/4-amino-4-deoxychorismate lyase